METETSLRGHFMTQTNRRSFLRQSACTLATFAAPMILPRRVFGANDRIAIAAIGVRNQGAGNVKRFLAAGVDIVAAAGLDEVAIESVVRERRGEQATLIGREY